MLSVATIELTWNLLLFIYFAHLHFKCKIKHFPNCLFNQTEGTYCLLVDSYVTSFYNSQIKT